MAGLEFNYPGSTPIDSPIKDKTATGKAVGGLRFAYESDGEQAPAPGSKLDPSQGDVSRGFGIAVDQAKQTAYGAKGLAGAAIGDEQMRDSGLAEYKRRGAEIATRSKDTDSFSNIWESGDFGDAIDWLQYGAGYVGAQAAMVVGTSLTGNVAGGLAALVGKGVIKQGVEAYAKKALKEKVEKEGLEAATKSAFRDLGAGAAVAAYNLTTTGGSIYGEAVEEQLAKGGKIEDVDLLRVMGATVLSAGLETWVDRANLKGIGKALSGGNKSDAGLIKRIATEAFASGLREAGTELVQSGVERWGAAKELTTPEAIREYVDSAALGFLGGGMAGTVKGALARPNDPAAPPAPGTDVVPYTEPPAPSSLGNNILVTPELKEKFAADLQARGIDPDSPQADEAVKALEAVERATGVIRARFAAEERAARQKEVEAAFGDTATSGVGVGVGGADTILQRSAVQPNEQDRTVDVLDPNARMQLPATPWGLNGGATTEAVSGEDVVARQEGWEVVPVFELKPDANLPAAIVMNEGGRPMARNYFTGRGYAQSLADYLSETYEGVQARVRSARRSKDEGGGSYFFVEIKPDEGFQWPLKARVKGAETAKLGAGDLNTVDVEATEAGQPPAAAPGAPPAVATTATTAAPAATTAPAAAPPTTTAAPKPSTSAGKPTGTWKNSPQAAKIQKVIDDLTAAGLEKEAKAVDIGSSVDADKGQLDDAKVETRAKWAASKIKRKTAAATGTNQKPAPAEDTEAEARWTRSTPVERAAWAQRAGLSTLVGRLVSAKPWKDIGKSSKAKLLAEDKNTATPPLPTIDPNAIPAKPAKEDPDQATVKAARDRTRKRSGRDTYLLDVAPEPTSAAWKAAREVAERVFGARLIPVTQKAGRVFNGLLTKDGAILIDVDSAIPPLAVLGHELLHAMRASNPELYDRFIRDLLKNARNLSTLRKALDDAYAAQGLKKLSENIFQEEFFADVVGDFFTDPKFWQGLQKRDQGLFQQVADFVLGFLDDLYNKLMRQEEFRPFRTDKFLKDLVAARRDVIAAMGEYAESRAPLPGQDGEDRLKISSAPRTKDLPAGVAVAADIDAARVIASSQLWPSNRDFKMALQRAVRAAAGRLDLSKDSPALRSYLVKQILKEARAALIANANAVGWYDEKVTTALEVLSEIHPELKTDQQARFAFIWALAVTSNGVKVDKNFEIAERAYSTWKASSPDISKRLMPTKGIGVGTAAGKIDAGLATYNILMQKWGYDRLRTFATKLQPNREVKKEFGRQVSGEGLDTMVYGAGILGPKIGNGFFMNLFGEFGQLTMDRWWVRMWGRLTGDLVEIDREKTAASRASMISVIDLIKSDPEATKAVESALGMRIGKSDPVALANAIVRKTSKSEVREALAAIMPATPERAAALTAIRGPLKDFVSVADELRKAAKTYFKNLDGQIEVPGGAARRDMMRAVSADVLAELRKDHPHLTTSDFQALMWYPEKTLYDSAGTKDEGADGYDDAEAPDYANAAIELAITQGISDEAIQSAVRRARSDIAARQRAGRGGRGAGSLGAAADAAVEDRLSITRDGSGRDQGRGLAPLAGAPQVQGASGPDPRIVEVAESYARANGIPLTRQSAYAQVDPERAKRIADAYAAMPHAPDDPRVLAAYEDMIRQTRAQYDALAAAGYQFTFFTANNDPYQGNPWNAMRDLRANKRMAVYGTYDGYGTEGITAGGQTLMQADTGLRWPDQAGVMRQVVVNDLFRAVHDAFGHGMEGAGFREHGEENAWQAHVRLFTGPAVGAITSETRGQNSWLNYGPYGERNRTAKVEDTVFAEQKTGLMPAWTWSEGRVGDEDMLSIDRESVEATPGVNLKRLAGLLGPQLYGDMKNMPKVAVKEMFQNAFDASKGRMQKDGGQGRVAVAIDSKANRITVADNGTGMTTAVLGGPFLQIAGTNKEGERSSGGFGIAKMQFLFGSQDLEVYTLRDGVLSVLSATGAQLMDSMDNPKARPRISVYRGEEALRLFREKAGDAWSRAALYDYENFDPGSISHGTVVTVTVPNSYVDPSTGATEKIETPDYGGNYEVLDKSPLLEDIKVNVAVDGSRWYGNKMGTDFPADKWTQLFDVKFAWGRANVYATKDPAQVYAWGTNADFLSNGLWQFSTTLKSGDTAIPRNFIVNIESLVKPEQAGYPFQLNRQGLTDQANKDFSVMANYLAMLYQRDTLGDSIKEMADVSYIDEDGTLTKIKGLTPPKMKEGIDGKVDGKAKIEVKDGKLVVNGRTVPVLSAEDMKAEKIAVSDYTVPAGTIDVSRPVYHNNLMVPRQVEELRVAGETFNSWDIKERTKDFEYISFEEMARSKFGKRFDQMNYRFAEAFVRLRDLIISVYEDDPTAEKWVTNARQSAVGVGYDQNYRGVNAVLPARQMLINPAATVRTDPDRGSMGMYVTMVHEVAHEKVRQHGVPFEAHMQLMLGDLMYDQDVALIRRDMRDTFREYNDVIVELNKVLIYAAENGIGRAVGRNLQSDSDIKRADAIPRRGGLDARDDAGAGRAGGGQASVPGQPAAGTRGAGKVDDGRGMAGEDDLLSIDRSVTPDLEQIDQAVANGFPAYRGSMLKRQLSMLEELPPATVAAVKRYWDADAALQASSNNATRMEMGPLKAAATRAFKSARDLLVQARPDLAEDPGALSDYLTDFSSGIQDYLADDLLSIDDDGLRNFRKSLGDKIQTSLEYGQMLARMHQWAFNVGDIFLSTKTGKTVKITARTFQKVGKISENNWRPVYFYESGNPPPRGATSAEIDAWPDTWQRGTFQEAALLESTTMKSLTTPTDDMMSIDRPGWDDRTRKALNDPFDAPARQGILQRLGGLRKDFLRRFTTAVVDPFVAIKDVDDKMYMRARLTNGTDGGMEALLHYGQVFDDGGALNVRKGTKGLVAALSPLGGEVEDFLRWIALNRAAELKKQDRENFFTDESISMRAKLIEGRMADGRSRREVYGAALKDLNALNRSVLELARKQGLIDQAGFDRFSKDVWYVPFYRIAEENDGDVSSYAAAGGLSNQDFGKRLKGGKDKVDDLLINILRNWGGLLAASQKNAVARDVLLQSVNMGGAKQVKQGTTGAVKVMVDGREKSYAIDDPLLVAALTSINTTQLNNPVLNVFGWFKRTLTGAVTIDPAFKIRNLIRDSIQAISLAELPFNPIANVVRGMRGTNDENRVAALAGGGLFHGHFFGEDDMAKKIQRLVEAGIPKDTVITDSVELTKRMMEAYGRGSDRLENANRVALYDALIAKGKTHLEAAYAARDLMDFSLQGRSTAIRMLAMTLPFFNARLQGLYKIGRDGIVPTMLTIAGKANDSQRAQAARFSAVTGGVVMASLLLYMLYKDDEEFQKREAWDRDGFWWFRIGNTAYRIPKPFEVGAIGTMAERALEQLVDDRVGGATFAKAMKDMLVNTFAFDPVPQMLRPALGISSNKDAFTGRPIETYGMQQLSKVERWGSGTTESAKLLSRGMTLGGTVNAALSPAQIDYLARAYFGWLGGTIMQSTGALVRWAGPIEAPAARVEEIPVLGAFVRELPSNQTRYLSEFYESAEKVNQKWQDIKMYQRLGQLDQARQLAAENRDVIALRGLYEGAQRQIADINTQMRRVTSSESMTPDRKREQLDLLSQRKAEIARKVELMKREKQMGR